MKTNLPTRKWIAAQIIALGAIAVMVITSGHVAQPEQIALVGWVIQAATTWLVPNLDTPGGVPPAKES